MPESRHKYLYERLGDHDFQQLVNALLTLQFAEYTPLPLRQNDGGRDGIDPSRAVIYQVKWSVHGHEKDPVSWLAHEIKGESEKIKKLAAAGAEKYVLATNVPSTAFPGTGTFDRLDEKLKGYSKDFGLEMTCLWREALDAMIDSAPSEIKWAYADMLAGWDLVRYLISEETTDSRDSATKDLLRKIATVQWDDDERIKFSQVDLDREHLSDLFVDVPAERIRRPGNANNAEFNASDLGGAAEHILNGSPFPFTLVRGAPGQGKSTLTQFICQAHRVSFMPRKTGTGVFPSVKMPRFPIRFDLDDFSTWINGYDVFDKSDSTPPKKNRRRAAKDATIEHFLAELAAHASGREVDPQEIQDLLERVPSLIVLDGLDEVGNLRDRRGVVSAINNFCSRSSSYSVHPKIIVTTRPNSSNLPEPDLDKFELISLSPLTPSLRDEFLQKWCSVHSVHGKESRTLRRNFNEKTKEPYIGELAGNPMQLTILLFLLRQHGDATPSQRTELYDAYMNLLLSREANKHPESVRKHREDLMEIIPFLGWYLQSRAEENGHSGKMLYSEVKAAMKHFQSAYGKPENVVDELFEATTDRLWAMTSKEEDKFEFEVISLREYFAARFLYHFSGEGDPQFDHTIVFRELLRRPYWLNTVRFYGGNAKGSSIYVLQSGIENELDENPTKQVHVAIWTLITDGVFNSRPKVAASIVDALTSKIGRQHLLTALNNKEISPLPASTHGMNAWERLLTEICSSLGDAENQIRVRVIRELLGLKSEFANWWGERLAESVNTSNEVEWLKIGADCEAAAGFNIDIPGLSATNGFHAQLILNAGLKPSADSSLEKQLIQAVFDGQCTQTKSVQSKPAQIAVALNPAEFYSFGKGALPYRPAEASSDRRAQAIQRLHKSAPNYAAIAGSRRFKSGEKDSTFPFERTATALLETIGRSWIASEIAVIGAASPLHNGFTRAPGTRAFGSNSHPATLIEQTRKKRDSVDWWREQLLHCTDDLEKSEWAIALWAIADTKVIDQLFEELSATIEKISPKFQRAIQISTNRLSSAAFLSQGEISTQESVNTTLEKMVSVRSALSPKRNSDLAPPSNAKKGTRGPLLEPLSVVVRNLQWLKVDQMPVYR